jgi:holliday junction DNA helicase RuvA
MIAFLRGVLLEKHPNQIIVDVSGVGYDVIIPVSTFSSLPETGRQVQLRIHTHVREDALSLFGFLTSHEKLLFEKLTSVSGIGPKLAITVLSGLPVADLAGAIRGGAVEVLVRVPGIGKKTAERIVLELKDKLDLLSAVALPAPAAGGSKPRSAFSQAEEDVISALINFGSNRASSEAAVLKAKQEGVSGDDFESLFRRALKLVR